MGLYLFPREALLETRPFLVAASGGGADDLMVVPNGFSGALPAVPGVFVAAARRPEGADASRYLSFADVGGPVRVGLDCDRGSLRGLLRQAVARFGPRLWAELRPLRAVYPLPCPPDGGETPDAASFAALTEGRPAFFAEPFCCMACVLPEPPARLALFDTAETLRGKLALARELGAANIFGCAQTGF